jgi:hypothetical protein
MKHIYDDTEEDDKDFMIERINKLTEYLAIEKNKNFMLEESMANLKRQNEQLQTKIIILESNANSKRHE